MSARSCYIHPPPGVDLEELTGVLIVIEGADSSGRSTQVQLLSTWLEAQGYPVTQTGLRRSKLVSRELDEAKQGNTLSPRTRSLFYATDFYDQLENVMVPALRAGHVVLSDRYIFTLMARDIVRGAEAQWLRDLYGLALVPDAVFFLDASLKTQIQRSLRSQPAMDYWESGMDLGLSRDWFESYVRYQQRLRLVFKELTKQYKMDRLSANRLPLAIHKDLRGRVQEVLRLHYPSEKSAKPSGKAAKQAADANGGAIEPSALTPRSS